MNFRNALIWITGASSGIGEACAYDFSRRGARCILSARREDRLHEVREHCARPDEHLVVPIDLAEPESIDAAAATVRLEGVVDLMLHNAGISQRSLARETEDAVVRRLMEVNFFGTVRLNQAILPGMLARQSGHIAVVTSLVGKFGTPLRSGYAASKHALHGYFDSLRAEVFDDGIRITLVCPGFIRTQVSNNALTADGSAQGKMDPAQAEGMPPGDCARAIADAVVAAKDEVYVGGREVAGVYLKRLSPTLFNRLIRSVSVTR
ncbi:short chain dehydrogenase [Longibacter salinarum]|uniref:Short chain dehydrogenase n=1 Tax=Longibacter salinarum TaxID=1850348 RepID=A0A2A8CXM4_9BACT|nr:SDR family oxidoreductase [Longibacter salinarum]PEN13489.1 short chain dehydrogenase [Longibacter salinarum]